MKNIRRIILFAILSFISSNLPAGFSAFKLQKHTTSCTWSGKGITNSRVVPYRAECAQPVKSWRPLVFCADQHLARLQHTVLVRVRLAHQQDQFKRTKSVILPVKRIIPTAKYTCNPFFA